VDGVDGVEEDAGNLLTAVEEEVREIEGLLIVKEGMSLFSFRFVKQIFDVGSR